MRVVLVSLAGLSVIAAHEPVPPQLEHQAYSAPRENWAARTSKELPVAITDEGLTQSGQLTEEECADRISLAREQDGQPPILGREIADPNKPMAIYAVDRRENACGVLVMKGDPSDIRPIPAMPKGPVTVMSAGAGIRAE